MADPRRAGKTYRLEAKNPYGNTPWQVTITQAIMDSAKARGPGAVQELIWGVPRVLIEPLAVFRGVRDFGNNLWLCYAGRPDYYYDAFARRTPSLDDEIFLVFVTESQTVYTYRWEDADQADPDLPEFHNDRFIKRLRYDDAPGVDR